MNTVFSAHPGRAATPLQRQSVYPPRHAGTPLDVRPPPIADDHERWYTEPGPNNRMVLALKSTIESEISWALERFRRICGNEQFSLRALPGLTEALFDWPLWYVRGGMNEIAAKETLFSIPKVYEQWRQHALDSVFILRNAANNPMNTPELSSRRMSQELILFALHRLQPDTDENVEFLLNIIDLLHAMASTSVLPAPDAPLLVNPVPPLMSLAGTSTNRSLIIASLSTLHLLFSNPPNQVHLTPDNPALAAAIRYLPLVGDDELLDASLNYLYAHLSSNAMAKAFLLSKELVATLKLLVLVILNQQREDFVTIEIAPPSATVPAVLEGDRDHDLTREDYDRLLPLAEPQRCFEWMKLMFESDPEGELTQVAFYNLYKDAFVPYQDRYFALPASEVIKNVSVVFPSAQAMVLPGPPPKFVVKGVGRRKIARASDKFRCRWDRSQCPKGSCESTSDLFEHLLEDHINPNAEAQMSCSWASCSHPPLSKAHIRGHVLTHLPAMQPPPRHPTQEDTITLPYSGFPHPVPDPTTRPLPPLRSDPLTYSIPAGEPSSIALTALLCLRVLFRASFTSSAAAPRVDENHFGFPGIIEDVEEKDGDEDLAGQTDSEKEGERRGRKAFVGVRHLLEKVKIRDDTLQGWIVEMVDAGLTGKT